MLSAVIYLSASGHSPWVKCYMALFSILTEMLNFKHKNYLLNIPQRSVQGCENDGDFLTPYHPGMRHPVMQTTMGMERGIDRSPAP